MRARERVCTTDGQTKNFGTLPLIINISNQKYDRMITISKCHIQIISNNKYKVIFDNCIRLGQVVK